MDRTTAQARAFDLLYPHIDPFDVRALDTGDGHVLHVEQSGNPDGIPVVVIHGGPGGGTSPAMRRFFDPEHYRIVMFDQRGCGRSRPAASIEANTTWHLVSDMERIRRALGIDAWMLFGGSWGATLALVYAITHPERVRHLVLRGVFLMTRAELDWFYGGGAARFHPEEWHRLIRALPDHERGDIIGAYHRRLFSGNHAEEVRFARLWAGWENALASVTPPLAGAEMPGEYARAFARLENHYFVNGGFLDEDGWILARRHRIEHLGATIIQGRQDVICPPQAAWDLARGWDLARLLMVPLAGHAMSEPGIARELVAATDRLARQP